jgi:hypothetical protein
MLRAARAKASGGNQTKGYGGQTRQKCTINRFVAFCSPQAHDLEAPEKCKKNNERPFNEKSTFSAPLVFC